MDYKSFMMNYSLRNPDAKIYEYFFYGYNDTDDLYEHNEETDFPSLGVILWIGIIFITCCVGFAGNGYIIWLLGFQMKRNCFTTFILHLAIADVGYLASEVMYLIHGFAYFQNEIFYHLSLSFSHMMYINSNFLLTAISIDRCVAVLFPIWHRCSRPKHLSSSVCIILWISSFLLSGIVRIMKVFGNYRQSILQFLLTAIICLPLTTLSTVVLFIKVCLKSQQIHKGRLLLMVIITLLCFLILAFPLNVLAVMISLSGEDDDELEPWIMCSMLLSCLNSSINPVIYFLVGRRKGAQSKESMKFTLQKVFKEGEATQGR